MKRKTILTAGTGLATLFPILVLATSAHTSARAQPAASCALNSTLAPEPISASASLFELPDPAWREKFKKALAGKDAARDAGKLVETDTRAANLWVVRAGESLAEKADADQEAFLSALTDAYKTALKSEFPARFKTYLTGLSAQDKKDRAEMRKSYDGSLQVFEASHESQDTGKFRQLANDFQLVTDAFDQLGDQYFLSEAAWRLAQCCDEPLRGETADLKKALTAYTRAAEARKQLGLEDQTYQDLVKRRDAITARGTEKKEEPKKDDPKKDEPVKPVEPQGQSVTVPLAFEIVSSVDAFQRPAYNCDELFQTWDTFALQAKGSSASFAHLEGAPKVIRTAASEVRIDVDGDGTGDEKLPLTGNIVPVKIMLGKGAEARPWAFLVTVGGQQDFYQGVTMNMQANDTQWAVYTFNAASVLATVDGVPLRILDDSMDGQYGSTPVPLGYVGLTKEHFQPDLDSVVIGASKRGRPWSQYQEINARWWRLEGQELGKELRATPITIATGTLKLVFTGPVQPAWIVLRGQGELKNCFFDLVEGGAKGISVPAGNYELFYGEMRKGKKRQLMKSVILPGVSESYEVEKGKVTTVALGGPFGFAFDSRLDETKLTVVGTSVCVIGAQGERYERPWGCVSKPEVSWRKKGQKSGSKPVKMDHIQDTDGPAKYGWGGMWFPLDLALETKEKAGLEVQLVDKKHEMFGKIESVWKE